MTARRLYVRLPMFDPGGNMVADRVWNFYLWWNANEKRICKTYGISLHEAETVTPLRPLDVGGIVMSYPSERNATVAKGLAIRIELTAILYSLPVTDREYSYFVQIDGSGAIDYQGIELVLEKLLQDPESPEVVLGKRPNDSPDWFMGHPERKAIELFEKFLIEERFRTTIDEEFGSALPDAQAGCWGLRMDTLRKLSLTAGGYELELDVVTSALELLEHSLLRKKKVAFTRDLSYGQRIGGGGGAGRDTFQLNMAITIDKLPFFLHKLGYDKSNLEAILNKYERTVSLPHEYVVAVREWIANQ